MNFLIGRICGALCAVCAAYAVCSGHGAAFSAGVLDGIARAVSLTVTLGGAMCFWGGILEAARRGGVLRGLCRLMRPLFSVLFPQSRKNPAAAEAICASFCANFIGLGNAATPLGIAAVRAMREQSPGEEASDDMILFTVLNTTVFSLLPTNLLSLRRAAGSARPFAVLCPVWICSLLGCLFAILLCRLFSGLRRPGKTHLCQKRLRPAAQSAATKKNRGRFV